VTSHPFTLPLVASVLLHVAGLLASTSRLVDFGGQVPAMELIPIQVVTAEPTPSVPLLQPKPELSKPLTAQKITPPRLIETPPPLLPSNHSQNLRRYPKSCRRACRLLP